MVLDVHPLLTERISKSPEPVYVTEGILKADALVGLGLVAIGMFGAWGWKQDSRPLPDWLMLSLEGREVRIALDSDHRTNFSVRKAGTELRSYLSNLGAKAVLVDVPAGPGGRKQGIDDYIQRGGNPEDLGEWREERSVLNRAEETLQVMYRGSQLQLGLALINLMLETGTTFVEASYDRLRKETGLGNMTIYRAMKVLAGPDGAFLRTRGLPRRRPDRYDLNLPIPWEAIPSALPNTYQANGHSLGKGSHMSGVWSPD